MGSFESCATEQPGPYPVQSSARASPGIAHHQFVSRGWESKLTVPPRVCSHLPQQVIDFDGPIDLYHFYLLRAVGKGAFGKVRVVQHKQTKVSA